MKPSFHIPLILEYIDGKNFKIINEFEYDTDVDALKTVEIPEGFITDFASIPKILWNLLPPTGPYGKAAVVHDFLYRTRGMASKADADLVFLEGMKALNVSWPIRYTIYWAVRLFGGFSYKGGR